MESIQKQDIVIPVELSSGRFTLAEIGAIVVLMCIPHMDVPCKDMWNEDEDLMSILDLLIDEGIAKTETVDGTINLVMEI
jgi:hypothetical protein